MLTFCESIVEEIKLATDETEIQEILGRSIKTFENKTSDVNNSGLVMGVIVSLRVARVRQSALTPSARLILAIDILRHYQKSISETSSR